MRHRMIDDVPEDEDVSRLMMAEEVESYIAEKTRELIDAGVNTGRADVEL